MDFVSFNIIWTLSVWWLMITYGDIQLGMKCFTPQPSNTRLGFQKARQDAIVIFK